MADFKIGDIICKDDVLRYGVILTDDNLYCELQTEHDFK